MNFETLHKDMIAAMKAKDKTRKEAVSSLVSAVKKAAIDEMVRDDIPDELVDRVILKEVRLVREQVDTCPAERAELKTAYENTLRILEEYAPAQLSAEAVREIITIKFAAAAATRNKGQIMKAIMGELQGKADGKVISQVVSEICSE